MRASFALAPPLPYSLALTAARFRRFPEVVNRFDGDHFERLIFASRRPLWVRATQEGARLRVRLCGAEARRLVSRRAAEDLLARTLGTAVSVRGFYRAFRKDPLLGPPIAAFRGLRTAGFASLFEALVTATLSQQINLRFAYDIRRELCLAFGRRARLEGEEWIAFPTARRLARESEDTLRGFRLSRAKAGTLAGLAHAFSTGKLSEAKLRMLPDREVIETLTGLRGIGRWTAETALIRGLGRPDAFPAGDLGVIKTLAKGLLGRAASASEREMREFSERWRPHRALALTYAYAELSRRRKGD